MAAKSRSKSSSQPSNSDRAPASAQPEDAAKSQSQRAASDTSGALLRLLSALCSLGLVAGAVIVSMSFYQELTEIRQMSSRHEESVQRCDDAADALQQMRSMQASLESAVLSARTDLERTGRAVQKGEASAQRLEDSLQNLQLKISQDLTRAVREQKEARERDASTLEEHLTQLSRSTAESSAQQSHLQSELQELRARLEQQEAPALLRQELASLSAAVATLHTASKVSEGNAAVLREQIAEVSAELQTRNGEVASVSEDVEAVRTLLQSTAGSLRDEVSAARAAAQSTSDRIQSLSDRLEQSSGALQSLEIHSRNQLIQLEKRQEEVDVRLKSVEESQEALASSLTEQTNRLSTLAAKLESQQDSLDNYKTTGEKEQQTLRDGLEGLRSSLEELQTQVSEIQERDAVQEKEVDAFKNIV